MASTLVADGLEARASVERFSTHELGPTLERFQSSGMLEEGRINLIGLDAIAERLGDRWPGRREQIYHHVERTLTRHLEGDGFFQRVSPTDYLVVQPALGKFSAQVSCLLYLRELLTHFLGGGGTRGGRCSGGHQPQRRPDLRCGNRPGLCVRGRPDRTATGPAG